MDGNGNQNIIIEKELSPEYNRIREKWKSIMDFNNTTPLSGRKTTAILIESQEKWFIPEQVRAATPNLKHEDQ